MQKSLIFTLLLSLLELSLSFAEIIKVDNKHPYAGEYKTLQEAHDAATTGDLIYVSPSLQAYTAITVTKQLSIYGVGFDITEAIGGAYTTPTRISGEMIFNAGSDGSQIEGFDGSFNITVNAPNVTIKRNNIFRVTFNSESAASSLIQNKIIGSCGGPDFPTVGMITIYTTNLLISNNIFKNTYSSGGIGCIGVTIYGGNNLTISNNVFQHWDGSSLNGTIESFIFNNIFVQGSSGSSNNVWRYNMSWESLPAGEGNLTNIDMNSVFVDYPNENFHLLPNSPARGTGENGTNMGIYGGETPYVDGGFPGLPSILQIQAPTAGSQQSGLDINFKAKSNKE